MAEGSAGAGAGEEAGTSPAPSRPVERTQEEFRTVWHRLASRYEWTHTMLGIGGNALFVVGSVLFLWESTQTTGVWLFIVGSALMLVGAVGSALLQASDD